MMYKYSRFISVWCSTHHSIQDFAKYYVFPIQPRCSGSQDEELWSIGVGTSVRHTHLVWTHTQFSISCTMSSPILSAFILMFLVDELILQKVPHIPLYWALHQKTEIQTCVCSPSLLLNASVWSSHLQKLFHRCCDLHRRKECGHFHVAKKSVKVIQNFFTSLSFFLNVLSLVCEWSKNWSAWPLNTDFCTWQLCMINRRCACRSVSVEKNSFWNTLRGI